MGERGLGWLGVALLVSVAESNQSPTYIVNSGSATGGSCPGKDCTLAAAWAAMGDNGTAILTVPATIDTALVANGCRDHKVVRTIVGGAPGVYITPGLNAEVGMGFLIVKASCRVALKGLTVSGFHMTGVTSLINYTDSESYGGEALSMEKVVLSHNTNSGVSPYYPPGLLLSMDRATFDVVITDSSFRENGMDELELGMLIGYSLITSFPSTLSINGLEVIGNVMGLSLFDNGASLNATGLRVFGNSFGGKIWGMSMLSGFTHVTLRKSSLAGNNYTFDEYGSNVLNVQSLTMSEVFIEAPLIQLASSLAYMVVAKDIYMDACSLTSADGHAFTIGHNKNYPSYGRIYNRNPASSNLALFGNLTAVGCTDAGDWGCPPSAPRCFDRRNSYGDLVGYSCA